MKTSKIGKEAVLITRHINNWLNEYAPLTRNLSQHTVTGYKVTMILYLTYLEKIKVTPSTMKFTHFDRNHIEEWIKWLLKERGCKPYTCNLRLSAIKAFLKYVATKEPAYLILSQEASLIPKLKTQKVKVNGISKEAMKIFMQMPNTSTKSGRRDMALLVLMYGTAARIDEILSLTVGQLNLQSEKPYVTFLGKGQKTRTIFLLPKVVAHLRAYIKEYHPILDGRRLLFYSRNGNQNSKLTQPAINKRIKLYAAMGNEICPEIPLNLHAHQIRHTKATHWLEDGMNIVQISYLLGHANVQTTMRYLDVTMEQEDNALATLEDEKEKNLPKKWKGKENSLRALCGL